MGTEKSKKLIGKLLFRKEELEACASLDAVIRLKKDVNYWLGNLMRSTTSKYTVATIEGCVHSWRLATDAAEKRFDTKRFTA